MNIKATDPEAKHIFPLFNGHPVSNAVEADDEEGYMIVIPKCAKDEYDTRLLKGKVQFVKYPLDASPLVGKLKIANLIAYRATKQLQLRPIYGCICEICTEGKTK